MNDDENNENNSRGDHSKKRDAAEDFLSSNSKRSRADKNEENFSFGQDENEAVDLGLGAHGFEEPLALPPDSDPVEGEVPVILNNPFAGDDDVVEQLSSAEAVGAGDNNASPLVTPTLPTFPTFPPFPQTALPTSNDGNSASTAAASPAQSSAAPAGQLPQLPTAPFNPFTITPAAMFQQLQQQAQQTLHMPGQPHGQDQTQELPTAITGGGAAAETAAAASSGASGDIGVGFQPLSLNQETPQQPQLLQPLNFPALPPGALPGMFMPFVPPAVFLQQQQQLQQQVPWPEQQAALARFLMFPRVFPAPMLPASYPPPHRQGIDVSLACDTEHLSEYQVLIRRQMELFEAAPEDVASSTQGRKKQVFLGQVGIRCKHCASYPLRARGRGAVYYPRKLEGVYQSGQNMAVTHLAESCEYTPPQVKEDLVRLREQRGVTTGGKQYWADCCRALGCYETKDGLKIGQKQG